MDVGRRCPLAGSCLRRKAWREIEARPGEKESVRVVNPLNPEIHYATKACTMYRNDELVRFAIGMTSLYDNIEYHLRSWVRSKVMATFSSQRTYYYYRVGKYKLTPEMQERIARIFKQCHLTVEPKFDKYSYEYAW